MISTSFAYLVKSNNGAFKSEVQALYLLGQCDGKQKFVDSMPKDAVVTCCWRRVG